MTISKRLSRANRIQTNENNIVEATLTSVEVVESDLVDQETGEIDETEQIEWIWELPTVKGKNTSIREWTGLNVNSEKTWFPEDGSAPQYNKLTTILIQTGLLNEKAIDDTNLESIDIESLIGQKFEFELERRKKNKTLKSPKLSTIKLVD